MDANAPDKHGVTPLHLVKFGRIDPSPSAKATKAGSLKSVEVLLEFRGSLTAKDARGRNALHWTCLYGTADCAKTLMSGYRFEADNFGLTPLHLCAWSGNHQCLKLLIGKGADVQAVDKRSRTPFHLAAFKGSMSCLKELLNAGAPVNSKDDSGMNPLHFAAINNQLEALIFLFEHGSADPNDPDFQGRTVLHIACNGTLSKPRGKANGREKIVEQVLRRGAKVNMVDKRGRSALHVCSAFKGSGLAGFNVADWHVMQVLQRYAANPNLKDCNGNTALHIACKVGHCPQIVRILLQWETSMVNQTNKKGWTPLHIAARSGNREIVQMLVDSGADVNAVDPLLRVPAHLAALRGFKESLQALLDQGNNINKPDKRGKTPLHHVRLSGPLTNLRRLLLGDSPAAIT